METLEQIKADAVEVFHFDRECRPQDRAHAYLGKYRVRRGYNDTAMQVAVTDMIERAYEAGRAEVADANLVQNLRRQLTSIKATVGDAIDLLATERRKNFTGIAHRHPATDGGCGLAGDQRLGIVRI